VLLCIFVVRFDVAMTGLHPAAGECRVASPDLTTPSEAGRMQVVVANDEVEDCFSPVSPRCAPCRSSSRSLALPQPRTLALTESRRHLLRATCPGIHVRFVAPRGVSCLVGGMSVCPWPEYCHARPLVSGGARVCRRPLSKSSRGAPWSVL